MMMWNGSWSWWTWLSMMASMIVFWGILIWAVVALIRYLSPRGTAGSDRSEPRARPEDILTERLARGEIDAEEYGQRLAILRSPYLREDQRSPAVVPAHEGEPVH